MQKIVREICGIPYFLLKIYLIDLGGRAEKRNLIVGEGWTVRLKRMEPVRIGSLSVGQMLMTLEIEDHLVDDFMTRFSKKTMRAGG